MFYEPDFKIMNSFGPPNSLIIFSPEPQTIDFQTKINFKHALRKLLKITALRPKIQAPIPYAKPSAAASTKITGEVRLHLSCSVKYSVTKILAPQGGTLG